MDPAARFMDKVSIEPNSGCWLWAAGMQSKGYGTFYLDGRLRTAHRASWMIFRGDIPSGMLVMHVHDDRWCVNPDHLRIGTPSDNSMDMVKKGRQWLQKRTHCPRGHELTGDNLDPYRLGKGHRICRACGRAASNKARNLRRANKKAA